MDGKKQGENEELAAVAELIMARFPDHGFMLVVFPFNAPGTSSYISNLHVQDVAPALKSAAAGIERLYSSGAGIKQPINGN